MNDCACVYVGDYDGPEFVSEKIVKARKIHKCGECGREISPGEKYEKVVGKWEGDLSSHKTCVDCLSIRDNFFCNGWAYGGIWEHLQEHLLEMQGSVSSDCLIGLTPKARESVCEHIEDIWERYFDDEE